MKVHYPTIGRTLENHLNEQGLEKSHWQRLLVEDLDLPERTAELHVRRARHGYITLSTSTRPSKPKQRYELFGQVVGVLGLDDTTIATIVSQAPQLEPYLLKKAEEPQAVEQGFDKLYEHVFGNKIYADFGTIDPNKDTVH